MSDQIIMVKPKVGQTAHNLVDGFTGKVVEVIDYATATEWMVPKERNDFIAQQRDRLGADYPELYFEVRIEITEVDKTSAYKVGNVELLAWDELADCEFVG